MLLVKKLHQQSGINNVGKYVPELVRHGGLGEIKYTYYANIPKKKGYFKLKEIYNLTPVPSPKRRGGTFPEFWV